MMKGQLLDNIRAIYAKGMSSVRTSTGLTDWFQLTRGVRQGCVLSPLLFIVYKNNITKEVNPDPEDLNEMLFADDQSLANEKKLQKCTNSLNTTCEECDMKISISQTETMTYQCQTWNKSLEGKITTCEMRCLRRAVNKTRRDMLRNEQIRKMVGTTPAHHYI